MVREELKAKAKKLLEDDEKSPIYTQRNVEVERVWPHEGQSVVPTLFVARVGKGAYHKSKSFHFRDQWIAPIL